MLIRSAADAHQLSSYFTYERYYRTLLQSRYTYLVQLALWSGPFTPGKNPKLHFKMAARRAYSVYPFPELTGPHGVGCSDFLLYTGKSDQALLVRIYYPSAQRPESVPKASLVRWLPHRKYVKAMLTSVMGMSSVLATPIAPLLSAATSGSVTILSQSCQCLLTMIYGRSRPSCIWVV